MTGTNQFLVIHGVPILFAAVLLEQLGLPLPALPWLLAAGALSASGKISPFPAIGVTTLACLMADALWFYLGRYRGNQVLRLLCRISLEPDSCVRRAQNVFTRFGLRGVVCAKFVPGVSMMAPPLAGISGIGVGRFLLADGLGSLLYTGCYIFLGYCFSDQIQQISAAFASVGGSAVSLLAALFAAYLSFKYWRRRRLLRELRMARITASELRQKQVAGENPFILDLRSSAEREFDPPLIQGAVHWEVNDVERRHQEIPRDRDIILYCSCPNEVTSARVALLLRRKGFTRVRPLLGGIDVWRENKYPFEVVSNNSPVAT